MHTSLPISLRFSVKKWGLSNFPLLEPQKDASIVYIAGIFNSLHNDMRAVFSLLFCSPNLESSYEKYGHIFESINGNILVEIGLS